MDEQEWARGRTVTWSGRAHAVRRRVQRGAGARHAGGTGADLDWMAEATEGKAAELSSIGSCIYHRPEPCLCVHSAYCLSHSVYHSALILHVLLVAVHLAVHHILPRTLFKQMDHGFSPATTSIAPMHLARSESDQRVLPLVCITHYSPAGRGGAT